MSTKSEQAWIAQPHRAMPVRAARHLLGSVALASLVIAGAFALAGAWLVLPFAGLELIALWLALRHLQRHAQDEERISVDAARIEVTRRVAGLCREHSFRAEFSRYWARLHIEHPPDPSRNAPIRLYLRCHGREAEIGTMLTEGQKQDLARQLKQQLGT